MNLPPILTNEDRLNAYRQRLASTQIDEQEFDRRVVKGSQIKRRANPLTCSIGTVPSNSGPVNIYCRSAGESSALVIVKPDGVQRIVTLKQLVEMAEKEGTG
jgi:hypothetical protein